VKLPLVALKLLVKKLVVVLLVDDELVVTSVVIVVVASVEVPRTKRDPDVEALPFE
jgi:hypothetical protein